MPDTKTEPKKGKGKFFQKHKTPILIISAVAVLIVVYIYVKNKNASGTTASTNVVPATTPANTGSGFSDWNPVPGQQGAAGPTGPAGPPGPVGASGPSGGANPAVVTSQVTPLLNTINSPGNTPFLPGPVADPLNKSVAAAKSPINVKAWTKLVTAKKPVVSKIGTQKTVNPQGGNGRIITLPSFPAAPKPGPKPAAVKAVKAAPKVAVHAPVVAAKKAAPPKATTLTAAKVTEAAYAGRK